MNKQTVSIACYCGSPATLQSNAVKYGREYGNGLAWICSRYPKCDGYVGTHPDGSPLGKLTDNETTQLRRQVHAKIDPLWKDRTDRSKKKNRGSVYGWLRRLMDMSSAECHIGNFNAEECRKALRLIEENPYEIR